jgi:hypothetical protein
MGGKSLFDTTNTLIASAKILLTDRKVIRSDIIQNSEMQSAMSPYIVGVIFLHDHCTHQF